MLRRIAAWILLAGLALSMAGCGSSNGPSTPADGSLTVTVGDVPLCDVLSFRTLVTGMTISTAAGSDPDVVPANSSIWVDWAGLAETSTVLVSNTPIAPGTYKSGQLTVGAPTMSLFDATQNPPIDQVTPTFSTETINFTINPPLVVTSNKVSAMRVEFSLPQSVSLTSQGQINTTGSPGSLTVNVTPSVSGTPLFASSSQGFGTMDGVYGYILSVNNTSADPSFTGSFVLQLLSGLSTVTPGGGPSLTVYLNKNSQLIGAPALNQLTTENFTEVIGYIDSNGNFVANSVMVENREDIDNNIAAFLGYTLGVNKDSSGALSSLSVSVRDEEPNTGASNVGNPVDLDSPPIIAAISPSTAFHFSAPSVNFANITPDASFVAPGVQVVVHGSYTPPPTVTAPATPPPVTVNTSDVYLPLQTVAGNYAGTISAASDNVTGAFRLRACASLFNGATIYVLTSGAPNPVTNQPQTQFLNVNGLAGLTPPPQIFVRGLLFYDQNGGTVAGVSIPAGSYVMLASQVHQP